MQSEVDVISLLPLLRAYSYQIAQQVELADMLVEQALGLAVIRFEAADQKIDVQAWLLGLVREVAKENSFYSQRITADGECGLHQGGTPHHPRPVAQNRT